MQKKRCFSAPYFVSNLNGLFTEYSPNISNNLAVFVHSDGCFSMYSLIFGCLKDGIRLEKNGHKSFVLYVLLTDGNSNNGCNSFCFLNHSEYSKTHSSFSKVKLPIIVF